MSLPEESVAVNTLPEVTTIPTGKKLIFTDPDTNEGGIITLENLTKQILQNLTSQTFILDQGNLTLLQAINQLNSKTFRTNIITDDNGFFITDFPNGWTRDNATLIITIFNGDTYIQISPSAVFQSKVRIKTTPNTNGWIDFIKTK